MKFLKNLGCPELIQLEKSLIPISTRQLVLLSQILFQKIILWRNAWEDTSCMIASFALPWSGYQEKIELLNWNLLVKVKRNPLVINE